MDKTDFTDKKGGLHHAWLILAACFMLNGALMGVLDNTYGLFYSPVCTEFGWNLSSFTAHRILYGLTAAASLIFADKVYRRFPMKAVISVLLTGYAVSAAAFGLQNSLAGFYIMSVIQGACGGLILYLPVPVLLNNWFIKKKGLALGLSASATGLFGAVVNPILNDIIMRAGWRTGYFARGAMALVIGLPLVLLFVRETPESCGLKPYGAGDDPAESSESGPAAKTQIYEYRLYRYILVIAIAMTANFAVAYVQHLSNFAIVSGLGAETGATFAALAMVGNMVGKWLVGFSLDRFGVKKTMICVFVLIFTAMAVLSFGTGAAFFLYPASLLLGLSTTFTSVFVPAAINSFAGSERFGKIMSRASTGMMVAQAFSPTIVGLIYDGSGSYSPVFIVGAAVMALSVGFTAILFSGR